MMEAEYSSETPAFTYKIIRQQNPEISKAYTLSSAKGYFSAEYCLHLQGKNYTKRVSRKLTTLHAQPKSQSIQHVHLFSFQNNLPI